MMTPQSTRSEIRRKRDSGLLLVAAFAVGAGCLAVAPHGSTPAYAATGRQGTVAFLGAVTSGGSAGFTLQLPSGASCAGAGPTYRWETFMIDATLSATDLTWGDGPSHTGSQFVHALYDGSGLNVSSRFASGNPAGLISGIPETPLDQIPDVLPVGLYKVGVACHQGNGATEEYWDETIEITADGADQPLGIQWQVYVAPTPTPTPTPSATPTPSVTPTPTPSVTPTPSANPTPTPTAGSSASGSGVPVTGSSPWTIAGWAVIVLALGRMVLLAGRRIKVLPPR